MWLFAHQRTNHLRYSHMTDSDTDVPANDWITDSVLDGSTYDRLRVRRFSYFKQPISQKLTWMAGLLALVALVAPIALTLPSSASETFPGRDPLTASPKVVLLGLFAIVVVFTAAASLTAVELYRRRLEPVSETQAKRLLNLEELASLIGLVTGSAMILLTLGLFAVGYGGESALASFVGSGGGHPFEPSGTGLSVARLAVLSLTASGTVFSLRTQFVS